MKKSEAHIRAVVAAFRSATGTPPDKLRTAITAVASEAATSKNRIHKIVVHDQGYKGRGAQDRAAADIEAGTYPALTRFAESTATEEASPTETSTPPVDNPTRVWLERAIVERNIIERVTRVVHRRYPIEDVDDVRGRVHDMIAYWANKGSFDAELAKGNPPSVSRMAAWVANRIKGDLHARGRDGLWRVMRGSRTQSEYRNGVLDATSSDETFEAVTILDEGAVVGTEFVDPAPNPEQVRIDGTITRDDVADALRNVISAAHPQAATRYLQVLEDVFAHQEDASAVVDAREQCSRRRSAKLISRVRDDIRQAAWSTVAHARAILHEVIREPFSTRDELITELRIPSTDVDRAIRMLIASGYITDVGDRSYLATDGGRNAILKPPVEGVVGRILI